MIRPAAAAAALAIMVSPLAGQAAEKTVVLNVDNMYCELCPGIVKNSLAKVDGVRQVRVSLEKKIATVTYDDKKATLAALTAATTNAGYPSHLAESAAK